MITKFLPYPNNKIAKWGCAKDFTISKCFSNLPFQWKNRSLPAKYSEQSVKEFFYTNSKTQKQVSYFYLKIVSKLEEIDWLVGYL